MSNYKLASNVKKSKCKIKAKGEKGSQRPKIIRVATFKDEVYWYYCKLVEDDNTC